MEQIRQARNYTLEKTSDWGMESGIEIGMDKGIVIQDLRVSLGGKTVLDGVNLAVKEGRTCIVLGPNGAGKTSLLRSVMGLLKPEEGRLYLLGKEITAYKRGELSRTIGYVPQGYHPLFAYSVLDMVVMGRNPHLSLFQVPKASDRAIALQALKDLGIEHLANRQIHKISGGELQLILLARGLVQNTPLLILDEPTSSLDINNQRNIMDTLHHMVKKKGLTVLVTLHDPNLALEYADDIIILKKGHVVAQLKKEDPGFYKQMEETLQKVYGRQLRIGMIEKKPVVYWN